jgi:hypothetical protein
MNARNPRDRNRVWASIYRAAAPRTRPESVSRIIPDHDGGAIGRPHDAYVPLGSAAGYCSGRALRGMHESPLRQGAQYLANRAARCLLRES